jgi:acetylglutamate kinase
MAQATHLQLLREGSATPQAGKRQPEAGKLVSNLVVVKLSGKILDDEGRLAALAADIGDAVAKGSKFIIVHGGGKQIDAALSQAGIETEKKDGIRVTTPKAMHVITSVLEGINHDIARAVREQGLAVRQAGIAGGAPIVSGNPIEDSCSGNVGGVDLAVLKHVLGKSDVVVMSSMGVRGSGDDYGFLNINADEVASCVAAEAGAGKLIMLSDKAVLGSDGSKLAKLDHDSAALLMKQGVITDGMAVKARNLSAAAERVECVLVAGSEGRLADILQGGYDEATRFVFSG